MRYSITVEDEPTSAVADTFKTFLGLVAANTAGYRGRLVSLEIGPSDNTPQDLNLAIKIALTDNTAAGTPGSTPTPVKVDPASRASIMTCGRAYSAEPTTYATEPVFRTEMNTRALFPKVWEEDDAPKWGPNQTLGLLLASRSATAIRVSATLTWEEY